MQIVSIGSMSRNSLVNNQVKLCHVIKRVRKICATLIICKSELKKREKKKLQSQHGQQSLHGLHGLHDLLSLHGLHGLHDLLSLHDLQSARSA